MDGCGLSPFTRMIISGEEVKFPSSCEEARTPRIQSSLGLEPKSDGSWTSSIISPLGEKKDNETLEEMSLSESSRSPDSPSPILAHRKKVSNLNLKRRRLSPYLKSESIAELDQNNPNISQEFPYCDISSKPYLDKPTESVMALPRDENDSPIVESYKVSTRRRTSSLKSIVPCEMKNDELSSSALNVKIDTLPDSKNLLDNFDENFEPVEDERGSPILNADVNEVRLKRHYSMKMKGKDVIMHGKESKVLSVCSFSPAVHNEAKDQVLEYQEKEAEMKSDLEEISVMQSRKFEGKHEKVKTVVTPFKQEDYSMEKLNEQLIDLRRKGPSLGMRRKGLDRTLSGLQLKSSKPFVSPCGANSSAESILHRPTKNIGLSKASSSFICVSKPKSEGNLNSPVLSLPRRQIVPVKPERSRHIFPISKPESLDKAKSIFGDDFDSFINEMAIKGGSDFSLNPNIKQTDPIIRAKNIFGKDFESIAREFPNIYQGEEEKITNQDLNSSAKTEPTTTTNSRHHQHGTAQGFQGLSGFKTGLGKPVPVSEERLRKAQSLFSSLTEINTKDITVDSLHENLSSNNKEFQTSKGEVAKLADEESKLSVSSARQAKIGDNLTTNEGSTVKGLGFSMKEERSGGYSETVAESINRAPNKDEFMIPFEVDQNRKSNENEEHTHNFGVDCEGSEYDEELKMSFSGMEEKAKMEDDCSNHRVLMNYQTRITQEKRLFTSSYQETAKSLPLEEIGGSVEKSFPFSSEGSEGLLTLPGLGFRTGSGKSIYISKIGQEKMKFLFGVVDKENDNNLQIKDSSTRLSLSIPNVESTAGRPVGASAECSGKAEFCGGFPSGSKRPVLASDSLDMTTEAVLLDEIYNDNFKELLTKKDPVMSGRKQKNELNAFISPSFAFGKQNFSPDAVVSKANTVLASGYYKNGVELSLCKESDVQGYSEYLTDKPTAFSGLSTSSGKPMLVSEASIMRAKAVLTDNTYDHNTDKTLKKKYNMESDLKLEGKSKGYSGLSTACEKWAIVPDANINKAKSFVADKDFKKSSKNSVWEETVVTQCNPKYLNEKLSADNGFPVAFGKPVFVSEATDMKVDTTLDGQDLENKIPCDMSTNSRIQTDSKLLNNPRPKAFSGFATASGKPVFISDASIHKAKEMLADKECKNNTDEDSSRNRSVQVHPKPLTNKSKAFSGFSTASGKHVFVSDVSIKKAKAILDFQSPENSIYQDLSNDDRVQTYSDNPLNAEPLKVITGFAAADQKSVFVSDYGINEAETIFDDKNSESSLKVKSNKAETTPLNNERSMGISGFATASGRQIYISDSSISKANKVFADTDAGILPKVDNFHDAASHETPQLRNGVNVSQSFNSKSLAATSKTIPSKCTVLPISVTNNVQKSEITPTRRISVKNPQITPLGIKKSFSLVRKSIFGKVSQHSSTGTISDEKDGGQNHGECDEFGDDSQDLEFIEAFAKSDPTSTPVDILTRRRIAREEVLKSIKDKKEVTQVAGKLYKAKCYCKEKTQLEDLTVQKEVGNQKKYYSCRILRPDDALQFIFRAWDIWEDSSKNIEGYFLADGGCLILSDHNTVGLNEIMNAFYSTPGVDPSLCPANWVSNHYKWIVQKLHWMDSIFEGDKFLSPENVLLQLKYRYDREIDRAQRSCLKKIFEQDDSPSKPLSLFVTDVFSPSRLELSDGWYSIIGLLDSVLEEAVKSNKIRIGTKLMVFGATLVGAQEPCDPLQKTGTEALRLSANGCRRIHWSQKLGYQPFRESPSIPLHCIRKDGGQVPRIKCLISRVYPVLYFIKKEGGSLILNQRMYESFLNDSECVRRLNYEKILEEVEKEVEAETDEEPDKKRRRTLIDEEEGISFKSTKQEDIEREVYKRMEECNNSTNAVPIIRMRIVDAMTPDSLFSVMLTFWRPSPDSFLALREGAAFDMFRLNPSSSSGNKSWEISLNTGRGTILRPVSKPSQTYRERRCIKISDLYDAGFLPDFFEFDIVAQVVYVEDGVSDNQIVVLRDTSEHYLYLKCWKGVKHYGWNKIVQNGAVLAISNIQWKLKGSVLKSFRCGYCTELTMFSESSCAKHLSQPLLELQRRIKGLPLDDVSVYKGKVVELQMIDRKMRLGSSYRTPGGCTFVKDYRTPGSAATISR
ncbi:breast cancer type 2 susceptibility protein-like isoform X2 [Artemia franciscana]|uniref:Uncharacterized protein n=1 Tax=Artemia franciscana TaxID=6661 RepID=A0AA88L2V9_ARTSF|nr:hypothetical protein QYM36_012007 [Artemia franciscana]KAK2710682.1 hypothetical protein QYM36_012007 [Artemia franciscana]KAK2710683.1 hypothetical protein QYM36_012007 [Artemia franciscana]